MADDNTLDGAAVADVAGTDAPREGRGPRGDRGRGRGGNDRGGGPGGDRGGRGRGLQGDRGRLSGGKAREVPEAITKATASAKKTMVRIPLKEGRTLHHDGKGRFGAGKVNLRSAPAGTGIIAGGPMRAVFESLGVADVVTKSVGSSNPYNMIRATFDALTEQTSPKSVAQRRGKKIADLLGRGGAVSPVEAEAAAEAIVE